MIVRVADVHGKPSTVDAIDRRAALPVEWTGTARAVPRALAATVNSTASGRQRSKPCRRAAASWLTTALGRGAGARA